MKEVNKNVVYECWVRSVWWVNL